MIILYNMVRRRVGGRVCSRVGGRVGGRVGSRSVVGREYQCVRVGPTFRQNFVNILL